MAGERISAQNAKNNHLVNTRKKAGYEDFE